MEDNLDLNAIIETVREILLSNRQIVETNSQVVRLYNAMINRQSGRRPTTPIRIPRRERRPGIRVVDDFNTRVDELVEQNGMTDEQISQHTSVGLYSELREENSERRCPISWTQLNDNTPVIKINGCGHIFTPDSLREWLNLHSTCPTCRYDLLNDTSERPEPEGLDIRTVTARIFAGMLSGSPIDNSESLASIAQRLERNVPNLR